MIEMFKNYPQPSDYIPNNRHICCKPHKLEIMAGETAIHTFEVPLDVENLESFEVIYQLGIRPVIIKDNYQVEYDAHKDSSTITCTLYPHETKKFGNTCLNARVQIKFYMEDNTISYSEVYKVYISNSIDLSRTMQDNLSIPPEPSDIVADVGYGYTTDSTSLKETTKTSSGKTTGGYAYTED